MPRSAARWIRTDAPSDCGDRPTPARDHLPASRCGACDKRRTGVAVRGEAVSRPLGVSARKWLFVPGGALQMATIPVQWRSGHGHPGRLSQDRCTIGQILADSPRSEPT